MPTLFVVVAFAFVIVNFFANQPQTSMEWVKLRRPAKYEIGGSGIVPVHLQELPEALDGFGY